ncbi:MAG: hydroxyisourate hydrolase [Planctomycetota bacterium]
MAAYQLALISSLDVHAMLNEHLGQMRSPITTHILNTALGRPASGVTVRLSRFREGKFHEIGRGVTDGDGRVMTGLIDDSEYSAGEYQLRFETADYFAAQGIDAFYPRITIEFLVAPDEEHYHVPLLLTPFGYTTYRGS